MRALQIKICWLFAAIFLAGAWFWAAWWLALLALGALVLGGYWRYAQMQAKTQAVPQGCPLSSPPLPIDRLSSLAEKYANVGTSVVRENQRPTPPAPVHAITPPTPTPDLHIAPPPSLDQELTPSKKRLLNLK